MHEGHRQRMYEKFCCSPDTLSDHEILEIILYQSLPRINTNPIAHDLIYAFGDLQGVFSATEQQLAKVCGIGMGTARYLASIGELHRRLEKGRESKNKIVVKTPSDIKAVIEEHFRDCEQEKLEMFLFDKAMRLKSVKVLTDYKLDAVSIPTAEVSEVLVACKPHGVILVHNHPSGDARPSAKDDEATACFCTLLNVHGVCLVDHLIFANGNIFSYHLQKGLDDLKYNYKLENLIKNKDNNRL